MTNWNYETIDRLYNAPFLELVNKAQSIHAENFEIGDIQVSTLLSIKTGSCPENCSYCPQSAHFETSVEKESLMSIEQVVEKAKIAKKNGAGRFCMGAAWRNLSDKNLPKVTEMIKEVKKLGLETCVTLGMLNQQQAQKLKEAGLDYYNHNLDTSREYYEKIITTRTYEDRLNTLDNVNEAGINICCGGIIGMGETREDRINFLLELLKLPSPLHSIPINRLIPVSGTPLSQTKQLDNFEFIKTIAIARILFPRSRVRLSAGREDMSDEMQTLCFLAGANSIFYGDVLLTANNSSVSNDEQLFNKLGIKIEQDSINQNHGKDYDQPISETVAS